MKFFLKIVFIIIVFSSCQKEKDEVEKIQPTKAFDICCKDETVQLLDVRTPEEYLNGHLVNAINIDINSNFFKDRALNQLSKDRVVIVYCLSGGRSHEAGLFLKKHGYKVVYDLEGGMLNWTSHKLKIINPKSINEGMSLEQFNDMLKKSAELDQVVIVDFNAKWCVPCKEVDKLLGEVQEKFSKKINVVKINIDNHHSLAKILEVRGVPFLLMYKKNQMVWNHIGLPSKELVEEEINKNLSK